MSIVISKGTGYSPTATSEGQLLMYRKGTPRDGTAPGVICLHGRGGDVTQYTPWATPVANTAGYHAYQLAEEGCFVMAIDDAGGTAWGNQSAMDRIDDAYNYLTTTVGAKAGKIGIVAWSMGGLAALNSIKRNTTRYSAAWLWSPATDLDWARTNGTWTAEISAAYPTGSVGFNVHDEPQSWRGIGVPINIVHATDDGTVPYTQTTSFVSNVNDANVNLRQPDVTGGHTNLFQSISAAEFIQFFRGKL